MLKSDQHKILLIRNDNIGDVVCTLPFIETLRKARPEAFIALLVCSLTFDSVKRNPYIDKIFVYEKAKHLPHQSRWRSWWNKWQVIKEIRAQKFDTCLCLRSQYSKGQIRLASQVGAKKIITCKDLHLEPSSHEVERTLQFLAPLGIAIPKKPCLRLPFPEPKQKSGLGIQITARKGEGRFWPISHYIELIRLLKKEGITPIISFGPSERTIAEEILKAEPTPFFASSSLEAFLEHLNKLALFVALNGGPLHLAAALQVPTIALYEERKVASWRPWGDNHHVLQAKTYAAISPQEVFASILNRFPKTI